MWKARLCCSRFPRKRIIPGVGGLFSSVISTAQPRADGIVEQFAFGLLHTLCGFSVAVSCGNALQDRESEARAQVLLRLGESQQRLQRCLVAAVNPLLAALFVDFDVGLCARTMIVEIGIEVGAVELLQALGVGCIDQP